MDSKITEDSILPDSDNSPQTFELRYEILGTLGVGATGRVLHVRDRATKEELALKVLEQSNLLDEHVRQRFITEILIGQSIDHPNFVKAYDIINYQGKDSYTMELVKGSDLGAMFNNCVKAEFSYEKIDSIMIQLLSGLKEIHSRGIVHRDIKLENIMLGSDGIVKLNDLGLAKILRANPKTDPGIILGTAQYLAPEYILSQKLDERADLYACGIILWELLQGERRFQESNPEVVIGRLLKSNYFHPAIRRSRLPKRYNLILKAALAFDPKDRFQTADEMREAFSDPEKSRRLRAQGGPSALKLYTLLGISIALSAITAILVLNLF